MSRWTILGRSTDFFLRLPLDNSWIENQLRPIAIGRNYLLLASSVREGQRLPANRYLRPRRMGLAHGHPILTE